MKIAAFTVMVLASVVLEAAPPQSRFVKACIVRNGVPPEEVEQATIKAVVIFRQAKVGLTWTLDNSKSCAVRRDEAIVVSFSNKTPSRFMPGAQAYALPFEGKHIEVFYDRVKSPTTSARAAVLAYVLLHEITHILQGIERHSETGIMKAAWSRNDYATMQNGVLCFTDADIDLIQNGINRRRDRGLIVADARDQGMQSDPSR